MPKISVVCPAYNHEKYIKFFIESVLAQTVQDFELIIVDDYSTDNTIKEIEKYKDERIKLIKHPFNQGVNATLTDGINLASSDIICTIASDDMLYNNYLEEIIKIFEKEGVGAVFVSLDLYDENNKKLDSQRIFENEPHYEILKKSFIEDNQLPGPGMAFKKAVIEPLLPFPKGLIQYSDWDLNNKLLLNTEVFVSDKCLIKYRVSSNSVSARSRKAESREFAETDIMMDYFLSIKNVELFKNIFIGVYEQFGEPTPETIPYFIGRIALTSSIYAKQLWGYKTIIKYISTADNFNLLNRLYAINFAGIMSLCPENKRLEKLDKKVKKYKILYNTLLGLFLITIVGISLFILRGLL